MSGAEALGRLGLVLRRETPEDASFLAALFEAVRGPDYDAIGWPDEVRRAFLADQCRFQSLHYARAYAGADFTIVERGDTPVGRLYLHRGPQEHRIVDISLLPQVRGLGLGGALLDGVCAEADGLGRVVSLHVETSNPARRLYARKGFRLVDENGPYWRMIRPAKAGLSAEDAV